MAVGFSAASLIFANTISNRRIDHAVPESPATASYRECTYVTP